MACYWPTVKTSDRVKNKKNLLNNQRIMTQFDGTLSEAQLMQFKKDGYLVIPDYYNAKEVKKMKDRAQHLLDTFDPSKHPRTLFTTSEDKHTADKYFLESSDKISYFFEEQSSAQEAGGSKEINKIGHYLHELDETFAEMTLTHPLIGKTIRSLGYKAPVILQSMLIFKQPLIGGRVNPHQDNTFLYTKPYSTSGFWIPLEDVIEENGCLWFIPGSHTKYPVTRHFKRMPSLSDGEDKMMFEYSDEHRDLPDLDDKEVEYKSVCIKAGSAVLLHGSVVHMSKRNLSPHSRYTFAFHIVEGTYEYPKENWIRMAEYKRFYDENSETNELEKRQLPN